MLLSVTRNIQLGGRAAVRSSEIQDWVMEAGGPGPLGRPTPRVSGLPEVAGALGRHESPTGQSRSQKMPFTEAGAPPWGLPAPTGRSEAPFPRPSLFLTWRSLGRLAIPVCDALEVRVSPVPNGLLHRFSCPALWSLLPPLFTSPPFSCLRVPPVSPAFLSNPCLPVARETTSLATSRHPYDMYTWEGKVPASCLGCWWLCSNNPQGVASTLVPIRV